MTVQRGAVDLADNRRSVVDLPEPVVPDTMTIPR